MSGVTIIGLGSMGTALAKTMLSAGHPVTVWNRSSEKCAPLVAAGAVHSASITEAIESSPVILVCVTNYTISDDLLGTRESLASLGGRTLVQLSTGTPSQVIGSAAIFEANRVAYLDGVILGAPMFLGTAEMKILISGAEGSWQACEEMLSCLAGKLVYGGSKIDSAVVLDLAWISQRLGLFMGVFQGLLLCQARGISTEIFGQTVAADARVMKIANTIHNNDFENPITTVNVWKEALQHIKTQAHADSINTEILDFIGKKLEDTVSAGHGDEDLAAVIKILKPPL